MFLEILITISAVLLISCIIGFVAATVREKIYLSRNMIILNNRNLSQKDIDSVDARNFSIGNVKIMSGDEIKIYRNNLSCIKGLVIGANIRKKTIIVAESSNLVEVCTNRIKKIKIISRYGKFLRSI